MINCYTKNKIDFIRHKGDSISDWKVSTLILLDLRYSNKFLIITFFGPGSRKIESLEVGLIYSQFPINYIFIISLKCYTTFK